MRIPKVDEYWYINANGCSTVIGRIVAVNNTTVITYLCKYNEFISYSVFATDSDVKWEPNLFWKLLGYV